MGGFGQPAGSEHETGGGAEVLEGQRSKAGGTGGGTEPACILIDAVTWRASPEAIQAVRLTSSVAVPILLSKIPY